MVTSMEPTGGARFDPHWGTFCQRCGVEAPTKNVAFRHNIGALVVRFHSTTQGALCKSCIHAEFWKKQAINVTVGWFGYISFVVAPIFILMNFYNYATAITLPPPAPGTRTADHDPAAMRRLLKVLPPFAHRINGGEPVDAVLGELCAAANATPAQARVFLRMITGGKLLSSGV